MLDIDLAAHLLKALPAHCRLILVGDQDQLPPVGPGSMYFYPTPLPRRDIPFVKRIVLTFHVGRYRDLMGCECVPRVVLTEIFRQRSDGSGSEDIARNAQAVNKGQTPPLFRTQLVRSKRVRDVSSDDDMQYMMDRKAELSETSHPTDSAGAEVGNGCVMLPVSDSQEAADVIINSVTQLLRAGRQPHEIQVLSPMKRGPCGTLALNGRLQHLLNPNHQVGQNIAVGDRVLQLVNDYDRNIFNGDMGIVAAVDAVKLPHMCLYSCLLLMLSLFLYSMASQFTLGRETSQALTPISPTPSMSSAV